ncbi:MAG: hypothetical protein H6Q18_141 [Bacteroidetes bacterium]|nr:hypothetical protein [Bacteroidota bacterium]
MFLIFDKLHLGNEPLNDFSFKQMIINGEFYTTTKNKIIIV